MTSTLVPPFVFLLLTLTSRLYEITILDGLFTALEANSPGLILAFFVALGCPLLAVLQGAGSLLKGQSRLRAAFYTCCGIALLAANLVVHFA